jgi:hypothetical protein
MFISFPHAAGVQPGLLLRVPVADGGLLQRVREEAKLNLEVMTNIGKNYERDGPKGLKLLAHGYKIKKVLHKCVLILFKNLIQSHILTA